MLSREFRRAVKLSFGRGWSFSWHLQLIRVRRVGLIVRLVSGKLRVLFPYAVSRSAGIEDFPLAALVDNCGFTAATFGPAHMQSDNC